MMIELAYVLALSFGLFAIGLAGIAADRHLIVIMLSVELIFAASIVALTGFFAARGSASPYAVTMLLSIFAVAAVEVMAVIAFYVYMRHYGVEFDMSKLSKMKW